MQVKQLDLDIDYSVIVLDLQLVYEYSSMSSISFLPAVSSSLQRPISQSQHRVEYFTRVTTNMTHGFLLVMKLSIPIISGGKFFDVDPFDNKTRFSPIKA